MFSLSVILGGLNFYFCRKIGGIKRIFGGEFLNWNFCWEIFRGVSGVCPWNGWMVVWRLGLGFGKLVELIGGGGFVGKVGVGGPLAFLNFELERGLEINLG